jgi:hypothetical protein
VRCGNARRPHPAGAAADDEQVVVELAHVVSGRSPR